MRGYYNAHQFALEIAQIADDHKCENVIALDLRGISQVTDFTIIATGTSGRQMRGVAEIIREHARKLGHLPYGYAGQDGGVWIVLDYVDVVFHVFDRSHRDYYDLELLWGDAPRLEWARSETA